MSSLDIVSKIDFQEIDNIVNSVLRELNNRYDFKNAVFSLDFDKKEKKLTIKAEDEYKIGQISDSIKSYSVKRKIDPKSFDFKDIEKIGGKNLMQIANIKEGIDSDNAKKITKYVKSLKIKVQASIRGEEVRLEGKKIDDLQNIMSEIKKMGLDIPLQFINFRS